MKTRTYRFYIAIILPLLLFLLVGARSVISSFPEYDDSYNATVAKNLSAGYGYATSYDNKVLFNPEVTTGPSLIFPAAIFIKLFGTRYWVPAFTTLVISFLLIFFITIFFYEYLLANSILSDMKIWSCPAIISLLLCLFWLPEAKGLRFLGEFPAALFVMLGAIIIFMPKIKLREIYFGGCILGLGIKTKIITFILIFIIIIVWCFFCFIDGKGKDKFLKIISKISILFVGIALPILLFEFYKVFPLGFKQYLHLLHLEIEFFKQQGSGINQIFAAPNLFGYLFNNFTNNYLVLQKEHDSIFILYVFILSLLSSSVIFIRKLIRKIEFSFLERLSLALNSSVLVLLIWWLFLNFQGWYRTVSPAIDVASFSIIISIFSMLRKKALAGIILIIFFEVLFFPMNWSITFSVPKIPNAMILSTANTSDYLSRLKSENKVLLGCGWWANRRLEYFMPQILNFNQCHSSDLKNSILVIDSVYWDWEHSEETKKVEKLCSQLIYESYPYKVFSCR